MQLQKSHQLLSDGEFLELIERKSASFYRVAYGYVRNEEDAKDIVQEAVCKAYVGKARLKDRDKFYPWFYRILTNTAAGFLRGRPCTAVWEEGIPESALSEEDRWDDALWVRDSLARIDGRSRAVVILKIYEDMTFTEIAQVLRKPENTVKSLYYRALRTLKERMRIHGS